MQTEFTVRVAVAAAGLDGHHNHVSAVLPCSPTCSRSLERGRDMPRTWRQTARMAPGAAATLKAATG